MLLWRYRLKSRQWEEMRRQQEMGESASRFRQLFERMGSGGVVLRAIDEGRDFVVEDCNAAAMRIEQRPREEMIGQRIGRVFPPSLVPGLTDVLARVWRSGEAEQQPLSFYRGRKLAGWREHYVYRLSSGELVVVYDDMTERMLADVALRRSEKNFRELVEGSLVGIMLIQDNTVIYRNPEQKRLFGHLPADFRPAAFPGVHPEDREKLTEAYARVAAGEQDSVDVDFRFFRHGSTDPGAMRWVFCRARRIEYQGRDTMLVSMIDMTRNKELEELVRVQDKMSSLGRVAAGIAHEIRNPLSGINIYLDTLARMLGRDGDTPERRREAVEIVEQAQAASRRIDSVIRRVIDFSRPGQPRFVPTDINRVVEEALALCATALRKDGVVVCGELAEGLPASLLDTALMEQVLLNLFNNAAEAMRSATERHLLVRTGVEDGWVVVRVADSGPGVPEVLRDKVFDPFYTTKADGTGIGLSLCHRIVNDHRGWLSVQESEWGGAEFVLALPAAAGDAASGESASEQEVGRKVQA
ncbi:MAG: PAS domain-containing sensor histidine kinase [Thermodesulfobacteriota bacterium]